MKMHLRKAAAMILALLISAAALTGCKINLNPADSENPAMVVLGEKVYLDEAKLYIYMTQCDMERKYGEMLKNTYGDMHTFWVDNGYWESALYSGPAKIYQTKLLLKYADENGIKLSDEDKAAAEAAYKNFTESGTKVVEYADNPSDALVRRYFEENALANRAYQTIVANIDTTFNEDEMLRKTFEGVYVTANEKKVLPADAPEGTEPEAYTEEEQKEARESAMEDIDLRMRKGETITDIVKAYENHPRVSVRTIEKRSISKQKAEELVDTYPYYKIAWELKTGEFSNDIIEAKSGTMIGYALHMLNDDDAEARQSAKDTELTTRRTAAFTDAYSKLLAKYKAMHVYEAKTQSVKYKGDAYPLPETPTESGSETPSESETEASK